MKVAKLSAFTNQLLHRLYLAAEAFGLAATGIGAFYDEEVHRYLNLTSKQGQVVYRELCT